MSSEGISSSSKRRRINESSSEEEDNDNDMNDAGDETEVPVEATIETPSSPAGDGDDENENESDGGNNNDDERDKRERRKRLRLIKELKDLRRSNPQQTLFPGDEGYQEISATTNIDSNEDDDDGDYQDEVENEADVDVLNADQYLDPAENEEEEGDGEDLLENAISDYQRIEALDTYGREGIDDKDYGGMDYDERMAADSEIAQREEELMKITGRGRSGRFYEGLMDDVKEDDEARRARRARIGGGRRVGIDEDEAEESEEDEVDDIDREEELFETEEELNLEAFDVPLREWIAQERTRREVMRKFRRFIMSPIERHDQDSQSKRKQKKPTALYEDRIRNMCSANQCTLEISYMHLMENEPILAIWLVDAPRDMFDVLNEAATRHTMRLFKSYGAIQDEIHVRIAELPIIDSLRGLRRTHLDHLVRVNGVVTRRSNVYPQLKLAYYDCYKCKEVLGPYRVEESSMMSSSGPDGSMKDAATLHQPSSCSSCESSGPFRLNATKTKYRNYQRVNLQETPGSVPPGRVPRTKEIILTNDLIDAARPGEEVEVTGIFSHSYDYNLTQKSGFPVFNTFIGANHIRRKEDASASANLTEADKAQILELARDPKIGERIVESIAPSIYGHRHVKMALAMSLFGAVPKNISDKHRIRGDINILLLGDPGTAKSQMLKYAESTAPRAVYSTGKGASAVGLTASVHKDPITKEWTLEGGALVLADRGTSCLLRHILSSFFQSLTE